MTLAHRYKLLVNACWLFAFVNCLVAGIVLYRVTHKYTYSINVNPPHQIVITNFTTSVSSPVSTYSSSVSSVSSPFSSVRLPLNYGFCLMDGSAALSYNGRIYHIGDYLQGHVIISISRSVVICDDIIYYFDNTEKMENSKNGNTYI